MIHVSHLLAIRAAANLLLIVSLAIQPVAALCGEGSCSASNGALSAGPERACCKTEDCRCCDGRESMVAEAEPVSCCGHAEPAAASDPKTASGPSEFKRVCACGQDSQPLSDSSNRSSGDGKRIDARVAFALFVAADEGAPRGETGRIGIDRPVSPEHFSQRNLCIWRL